MLIEISLVQSMSLVASKRLVLVVLFSTTTKSTVIWQLLMLVEASEANLFRLRCH